MAGYIGQGVKDKIRMSYLISLLTQPSALNCTLGRELNGGVPFISEPSP
jgi:hypothetical protein